MDLEQWASWRAEAATALRYPAVRLNGLQASAVGTGFASAVRKSGFAIWACSILPDHVHLVIARHKFRVEQIANLLKGEATKEIKRMLLHPHSLHANASSKVPSMGAERHWKVYLDSEAAIDDAIRYVEENPLKENKPRQNWSFVTPFTGLEEAWTVYHQ